MGSICPCLRRCDTRLVGWFSTCLTARWVGTLFEKREDYLALLRVVEQTLLTPRPVVSGDPPRVGNITRFGGRHVAVTFSSVDARPPRAVDHHSFGHNGREAAGQHEPVEGDHALMEFFERTEIGQLGLEQRALRCEVSL